MFKSTLILFALFFQPQGFALRQNVQVTPAPIRDVSSAPVEAREIDLLRFDFQQIYFGFEGPNYMRMKGEPPVGAQLIAHAQLFRQMRRKLDSASCAKRSRVHPS